MSLIFLNLLIEHNLFVYMIGNRCKFEYKYSSVFLNLFPVRIQFITRWWRGIGYSTDIFGIIDKTPGFRAQ